MAKNPTAPVSVRQDSPVRQVDAVVIGAGFSGIYMLHRLRGLGCRVQVFELGDGVGGTWNWNRYPGARCDIPSLDYSYSFDPELEQEWWWTEKYPTQPEILRYANYVADRFDLRRDIQFETQVTAAVWEGGEDRWLVRTDRGDEVSAQFVVHASGCLSIWKKPEVPGLDSFRGRWYHTARWPREGVDLTHPYLPGYQEEFKAHYREHREQARMSMLGVPWTMPERSALQVDPEERRRTYDRAWHDPDNGLANMYLAFADTLVDKESNDTAAEFVRERIREIVHDPEVAEVLCPKDYPICTKRLCVATDYYETFNRDNVHLVDLHKTPLVEITPAGVRTTEKEYGLDSLVLATGFDAQTGALTSIDIRGRGGLRLKDKWAEGPRSYLGIPVAGLPNMFIIAGPQSPSVLTNMMTSIEQHVEWIGECIRYVREQEVRTIEATAEAEEAWVAHNQEVADMMLFPTSDSWYLGSNVEGKQRVFMPYIGGAGPYRMKCDEVAAHEYEGFALAG